MSKFTDVELEAVINDPNKPIFVYEAKDGRILGHLFLMIKEVSDNNAPLKAVKTLFIDDLWVIGAQGQKIGEKLYQFALDYAKELVVIIDLRGMIMRSCTFLRTFEC